MKLVHWPLMGELLHLVQRGGDWAGPQPAQAPPCCTKCYSPPINGQCTNHRIATVPFVILWYCSIMVRCSVDMKGLTNEYKWTVALCWVESVDCREKQCKRKTRPAGCRGHRSRFSCTDSRLGLVSTLEIETKTGYAFTSRPMTYQSTQFSVTLTDLSLLFGYRIFQI